MSTPTEYLEKVLESQTFSDDDQEMKDLRSRRKEIEALIRGAYPGSTITIQYGGSKAKGTMIKDNYDLDIICYFEHDDTGPGESLKDIYYSVKGTLETKYDVMEKRSALRVKKKNSNDDFHIDVVPGRYIDDTKTDVYLYQANGEKSRLKTNPAKHISHIRDSGVVPAIRIMKLWRNKYAVDVKTFVLELWICEVLKGRKDKKLHEQMWYLWEEMKDSIDDTVVEDPANPDGNDLSDLFDDSVKIALKTAARLTINEIGQRDEVAGWKKIFGEVEEADDDDVEKVVRAIQNPPKAYYANDLV